MTEDQTIYFLPERFVDVDIGDGRFVPNRFRSRRRVPGVGDVELVIDSSGGHPRVVDMRITTADESGVSGVKLAQVSLRQLLNADVIATAAFRTPAAWDALFGGGSPFEAVRDAATVATRRKVSDDRLATAERRGRTWSTSARSRHRQAPTALSSRLRHQEGRSGGDDRRARRDQPR